MDPYKFYTDPDPHHWLKGTVYEMCEIKILVPSNCSSSEDSAADAADDSVSDAWRCWFSSFWFSSGVSANISGTLQYNINYGSLNAVTGAVTSTDTTVYMQQKKLSVCLPWRRPLLWSRLLWGHSQGNLPSINKKDLLNDLFLPKSPTYNVMNVINACYCWAGLFSTSGSTKKDLLLYNTVPALVQVPTLSTRMLLSVPVGVFCTLWHTW